MPAVPKHRNSHSKHRRRSASAYRSPLLPTLVACSCGELVRQYYVCPKCGKYRGQQVIAIKEAKKKEAKK